jgi:prevent-host-death family protein
MEMSVREARAQFATVIAAAERGERVTITRNGRAVAEFGPVSPRPMQFDWERLDQVRRETGLDQVRLADDWQERFDDPAFSREVLGLGDGVEHQP